MVDTPLLAIPVVYPWEEVVGNQNRVEVIYPDPMEYPTNQNMFAWVDVVHPVVRIPVHANQPQRVPLTQDGL
jgi:hypothetical protein